MPVRTTLELCDRAAKMVKDAGFVHHSTSDQSEACYYRWPGRSELLRVAEHKAGNGNNKLERVVAHVTFSGIPPHAHKPGKVVIADTKVESMVVLAIGHYFLRSRS